MKLLVGLLFFVYLQYLANSAQPYFPQQVIFSPDNNRTIFAIDEINQRAYLKFNRSSEESDVAYVMRHMPYGRPGSPQANHYVQLILETIDDYDLCSYLTYWEYSSNVNGLFPLHWGNDSSYQIKNYINFEYPMIHLKNASESEDYWYSNETCRIHTEVYPCQEIYFKKNTQIPIRYTHVVLVDEEIIRRIVNFTIYSIEKPSDTFFDSIPKNWWEVCKDDDLRVSYNPNGLSINLGESAEVEVWLPAPPHQIPGNNTVVIYWNPSVCSDCLKWTPTHLVFNATNFQERQILNITRIRNSDETALMRPACTGGGFDNISCFTMYLAIF